MVSSLTPMYCHFDYFFLGDGAGGGVLGITLFGDGWLRVSLGCPGLGEGFGVGFE